MTKVRSAAVFLDRDGTLMIDVDYCGDPNNVRVFPDAPAALRRLKDAGYKLIVITNQSGIGRCYFSEQQYRAVEAEVSSQVGDALLDGTYYCPHSPADKCKCRKPSAEMIVRAADDHHIDLARSFFVGDKQSDIDCGRNAGVRTVLVRTGYGSSMNVQEADFVAENLSEATDRILAETR